MKTPLATLVILLAAASFAGAAEIPHRCDVAWLQEVPKSLSEGVQLDPERVEAGPDKKFRLKLGNPKTCSDPAWRHVVTPDRSFGVQGVAVTHNTHEGEALWGKSIAHQAARLLVVDDLFQSVDAKGLEAVKAADAVIAAGAALGLVSRVEGQSVAHDLGEALTGEPFRSLKVLEVKTLESGVPSAKGADAIRAELEKIVKDGAGGKKEPGAAVAAFRTAALALYGELVSGIEKGDRAKKRFGALEPKPTVDFLCDSCEMVPLGTDEAAYQAALKAMVGQGIKGEGDGQNLPTAALNYFDRGLRNLISVRAAQVAQIEAAAAKLLGTDSVQAHITGVRLAEKGAAEQLDPKSVGGQMLASLAKSKDYQDLSQLYDNKRSQPGWLEGAEGQAVVAAMGGMEKDAKAAQVVGSGAEGRFEFTVGGQKRVANNVNVERFAYDAQYQQQILGTVTGYIAEGNTTDAKVTAALAAFRNVGTPGGSLETGLTVDQRELGRKLPKPTEPPSPGASGPVALSKEAGCGGPSDLGKNSLERYADKKRRAAATAASKNTSTRKDIQEDLNEAYAEIDAECLIESNWIKSSADVTKRRRLDADGVEVAGPREQLAYMNPDLSQAAALAELDKHCQGRRSASLATAQEQLKTKGVVGSAQEGDLQNKAIYEADLAIVEQYKLDIPDSVTKLREAYKTEGSSERKAVETATGYTGKFYKTERIDAYFDAHWGKEKQDESVARCIHNLGFKSVPEPKPGEALPAADKDFKTAEADNVDKYCGSVKVDPEDKDKSKRKAVGIRDEVLVAIKGPIKVGTPTTVREPGSQQPVVTPVQKPTQAPDLDGILNGGN